MDEGRFSISAQALYHRLGTAAAPLVIDVRRAAAFDADDRMLIAAVRREPGAVGHWGRDLRPDRPLVVYCVHGQEVSVELPRDCGMSTYEGDPRLDPVLGADGDRHVSSVSRAPGRA